MNRTPVVTPLVRLGRGTWAEIVVKDETCQVSGSFKYRGSFAAAAALPRGKHLVTASTGNHALALAMAAQEFDQELTAFLPSFAMPSKVEALRRAGAQVVLADRKLDTCIEEAKRFASGCDGVYVSSFDNPVALRGYRTLCAEVDIDALQIDTVFVPVGGGGLLAACIQEWAGRVRIVGVCAAAAPAMKAALAAGQPTIIDPTPTMASGLRVSRVGDLAFSICAGAAPEIEVVDDQELDKGVQVLAAVGVEAEPAGAAAIAAALRQTSGAGSCLCIATGSAGVSGSAKQDVWKRTPW